jgi:hypothetical protein
MPIAQLTYLASANYRCHGHAGPCVLPAAYSQNRPPRDAEGCTFEVWNEIVHNGPPLVRAFYHAYGREKAGDDYLGSVVHSRK